MFSCQPDWQVQVQCVCAIIWTCGTTIQLSNNRWTFAIRQTIHCQPLDVRYSRICECSVFDDWALLPQIYHAHCMLPPQQCSVCVCLAICAIGTLFTGAINKIIRIASPKMLYEPIKTNTHNTHISSQCNTGRLIHIMLDAKRFVSLLVLVYCTMYSTCDRTVWPRLVSLLLCLKNFTATYSHFSTFCALMAPRRKGY